MVKIKKKRSGNGLFLKRMKLLYRVALEVAVKQFGRIGPTHPTMNKKISKVETVTWTEPSDVVSVHVQLGTSVNDPFGQLVATSSSFGKHQYSVSSNHIYSTLDAITHWLISHQNIKLYNRKSALGSISPTQHWLRHIKSTPKHLIT